MEKDFRSWKKTRDTRDKLRVLGTQLNKITGHKFRWSELNSCDELCEKIYRVVEKISKESKEAKKSEVGKEILEIDLKKIKRDKQIYYWIALVTSCLSLVEFIIIAGARLWLKQ